MGGLCTAMWCHTLTLALAMRTLPIEGAANGACEMLEHSQDGCGDRLTGGHVSGSQVTHQSVLGHVSAGAWAPGEWTGHGCLLFGMPSCGAG